MLLAISHAFSQFDLDTNGVIGEDELAGVTPLF